MNFSDDKLLCIKYCLAFIKKKKIYRSLFYSSKSIILHGPRNIESLILNMYN